MHYSHTYNKKIKLAVSLLSLVLTTTAMADDVNTALEKALKFGQDDAKYGQIKLDLRYRYDNTDSTNPKKEVANASTLRLRLGYLTPVFKGLQGYAEFQGNQDIGVNSYNSTMNGKTQYETIADPQENELNQLWLSYKGIPHTEARLGRQVIQLDNDRFIGVAGWRQLERTYNAFLLNNTSLSNTTVIIGYISKAKNTNSIMQNLEVPLVNIGYNFADIGKLTGYSYLIHFRDAYLSENSNQTYGVSFDGARRVNDTLGFVYRAEYAYQSDYKNSTPYQADYCHIIGGFTAYGFIVKGAMEQLGGKGLNKTFDTPLGLLHKFGGWADVFLTAPNDGYRDVYASVEKELMGVKLTGFYRDWSDDTSKKHYGNEMDFMISKNFFKHYNLMAKYAYFSADADGTSIGKFDTQKIWFGGGIIF
ncbi:MAG: alginate export family protein [Methylobacter sp.]|uniref:alginate export family protein n=1 Tax=Methylobacter sp. TaxID=2051955 RepID=UPI00272FEF8D|nr:alginate export family protein [Methylobacter sp.]MDP1666290.1 alginate export family protein [Methylobacter sp.]